MTKTRDKIQSLFYVQAGNLELTRLLLSHGADASVQDGEGESSLMWAAEGGHTHVARLLVQHHSDISVKSEDGRYVEILHVGFILSEKLLCTYTD